ncbi:hypothetical protein BT69DRAFT_1275598, partial [Atractiella rhizophila]
ATNAKRNSGSDFIHALVHNNTTSFENSDKASLLHHAFNALHPNLTLSNIASGSASPSSSFGRLSGILSTPSLPLPTRLEPSEEVETLQHHHLTETQTGRLFCSESLPSVQCSQRSTMVSCRQTFLFSKSSPSGSSF